MNAEGFWAKVDQSDTNGCWPWTAGVSSNGRGMVWVDGKMKLAYRVAFELVNGEIPEGLLACHSCDNPICVRPSHIFLGTHADNLRDASRKGRLVGKFHLTGDAHPGTYISDTLVREARESYAEGRERQYEIADRLGVDKTTVSTWVQGSARLEAGGPLVRRPQRRRPREVAA